MRIAIGQINSVVGGFEHNRAKILEYTVKARSAGADCIVFPEMSLCGYPPMDLLDHGSFLAANLDALRWLQRNLPGGIATAVGYVDRNTTQAGKALQNVVAILHEGKIVHRQAKRLLPTYDVFDEARYFEPARESIVFRHEGCTIGIAICEDIWWETEPVPGARYPHDPVRDLLDAGATCIISPSASPFHSGKLATRHRLVAGIGRTGGVPVVYVNTVGANDSLVFDGYSFATAADGSLALQCAGFVEELAFIELQPGAADRNDNTGSVTRKSRTNPMSTTTEQLGDIEAALVLGIRDYLAKTGFDRVHLGLSGGIDSAVVAVLAARAVGPQNVKVFMMPSRFSSSGSVTDSEQLVANLGISAAVLPIEPMVVAFTASLAVEFVGRPADLTEENLQARIRGVLLMAYSNKFNSLTLTTGNKSELAVGYCTMYGDMAGGLAVIGDLFKTEVYALAAHLNREREIIPQSIIEKPPSAELRPDQKDQDSLPPYDLLDPILQRYLIESRTYQQIVADGFDPETVRAVLALVGRSEYKRRQAPPVIKVSPRAFGTGRRMPIARQLYEHTV